MILGASNIKQTAALAPMAGVGDRAFREICAQMGAAYVVTEMASSKGLQYNNANTSDLLTISENERPCAIQLFGDEPITMAEAAVKSLKYNPDFIDINMGCPAPKIVNGGSGSALMKNIVLAGEIIREVSNAINIPTTVKIRKGWDEDSINAVELAILAQEMGAQAIAIHGRTRAQMYSATVDRDIIKQVKASVNIPVIANGDISNVEDAVKMYKYTNCDLVMIGRAALGAPWIFRQISEYFLNGKLQPEPEPEEKISVMLEHIKLACEYKGEYRAMKEARCHVSHYFHKWNNAAELRRRAGKISEYSHLENLAREALEFSIKNR